MQRPLTRALVMLAGAFGIVAVAAAVALAVAATVWGSGSSPGSFQLFGCRMLGFTCAPQNAGPAVGSTTPYALPGPVAAARPSDRAGLSPPGTSSPGTSDRPLVEEEPAPSGALSLDDAAHVDDASFHPAAPDHSAPAASAAQRAPSRPWGPLSSRARSLTSSPLSSLTSSPPPPSKRVGPAAGVAPRALGPGRLSPPRPCPPRPCPPRGNLSVGPRGPGRSDETPAAPLPTPTPPPLASAPLSSPALSPPSSPRALPSPVSPARRGAPGYPEAVR